MYLYKVFIGTGINKLEFVRYLDYIQKFPF